MPGLQIIITKAGRAALVNAEHNGTAPLKITEIGITAAVFSANEDTTVLPGEIKRIKTISGEVVAADTMHVTVRDDGADTYTMRGIGYWLSNGVLLGVYSQPDPILQKSTQSMLLLAADVVFANIKATSLTFGDANFVNPPATVDRQGVVELATVEETKAGKDATRAVTPAGLAPAMDQAIANHKADADPHKQYLTSDRANALYFRKLPAITNSDTDCDTLLETGVRDVLVANDRGIIAATHLPVGGDGFGTLTTVNGGNFIRQVYTEGGTIQRTWERTGFASATPPFASRNWKLLWDSVTFDPARYLPLAGGSVTGTIYVVGSTGAIGGGGGGRSTIEVTSAGGVGDAAFMTFNRPGSYAMRFGIDVNGELSLGGRSLGANSYKVWHAGNFNPADKQTELGYTPVQQGTGVGQLKNVIKIGWSAGNRLKATVDVTDQGEFVFQPGLDAAVAKYLPLAGGSVFGTLSVVGSAGAIGVQSGSRPTIEVKSAGGAGDAAYMTFHRPDSYALHFGLDVNNDLSVGGWSLGANSYKLWHAGNFDPGTKATGAGFFLKWTGKDGQPTWLLGGNSANDINLYNPSNFRVGYATSAGSADRAVLADVVSSKDTRDRNFMPQDRDNGVYFDMRTNAADGMNDGGMYHGVMTFRPWGAAADFSGGKAHQLAFTENGNVNYRSGSGGAWNPYVNLWHSGNFTPYNKATGVGFAMTWAGQGGQPTWLLGGEAPGAINVYNPSNFRVNYANSAGYANQLSGQGLGYGGIGGYVLNKNKSGTGLPGAWEQRGQSYDYGSGAVEGNESSAVLWQRVA